ncbi:MAG: hypothetical protein L0H19_06420, partial [Salinisphaera sp.]|nr:hypothetical protein [Salinisphaera sp.]
MPADRDLVLKIGTLVEGAEDVRQLRQELAKLGRTEVDDTTREFRGGLDQARNAVLALGGVLVGGALIQGIANIATQLQSMRRQAQAFSLSVEAVQELQFAFRQYGAESKDIFDVLGQISDYALSALDGTESFVGLFSRIGISLEKLRGAQPVEILRMVADGLQNTTDSTARLASASTLLGDDLAAKFLPLLVKGSEEFDR